MMSDTAELVELIPLMVITCAPVLLAPAPCAVLAELFGETNSAPPNCTTPPLTVLILTGGMNDIVEHSFSVEFPSLIYASMIICVFISNNLPL
jgi:hypothetical protein